MAQEEKTSKSAFLFFIDKDPERGIDTESLEAVEKEVGKNKAEDLYLVIESYGGSPFSAVAIMNILHSHFKTIHTIVPRFAKSAGTLMSLGTDVIYMREKSALGPLDLPIEHHRDGSRISALDVVNTTTAMAELVDSIAKERYEFFKNKQIPSKEAAKCAIESATDFVEPIISQVDPYHLQKARRELRIGSWYAIDMLLNRMMKGDVNKAQRTARHLVHLFPAHEYSIYFNDAKNLLGLNVKELSTLKIWENDLVKKYEQVCNRKFYISYGNLDTEPEKKITSQKKVVPAKKK